MNKTNIKGFTLIEILFVIAILSVLASLGLSVLQQRAQQLKVERAALQMQQILQAGMAFKADDAGGAWPISCTQDTFIKYLSVNSTGNPWGNTTTCGPVTGTPKFQVKTQVPTEKIADQIIALLPNAGKDITSSPPNVFVYTEVSGTSGGRGTTGNIIFNDIVTKTIPNAFFSQGTGSNFGRYPGVGSESIPQFSCPSGMQGEVLFLTKQIYTGDDHNFSGTRNIRNLEYHYNCSYNEDKTKATCNFYVFFQAAENGDYPTIVPATSYRSEGDSKYTNAGQLIFQYMTYCKKTS